MLIFTIIFSQNTENVFLFDKLSSTNYIPEEPPTPPQIPEFRCKFIEIFSLIFVST